MKNLEYDLVEDLRFGAIIVGAVILSTVFSPTLYRLFHDGKSAREVMIEEQRQDKYQSLPQDSISSNYQN